MKRTLAFILSMMMVLTIMPASFLTALANGLGVRGDYTPNLSIDNAKHTDTWIPASIVVDGEIDDTGWIRDQWNEVNSATGTWNVVTPQHGDLSYEYQVQRDHQFLYGAYVIDMKSVDSGYPNKIALWLNDGTNGGSSWTQKLAIDIEDNNDGTYTTVLRRYYNDGNGGADVSETLYETTGIYLNDNDYYVNSEAPAHMAVRVETDGQVPTDRIIVEFRTLLDVFSDQKAYDEAVADGSEFKYNDKNNLSECESIKHFTVVEFNDAASDNGETNEGLYYPRLSTSEDRIMESPDSAWPSDAIEITESDVMNNDGAADYNNVLPSGVDVDGVFSEGIWSAISDFCQYGWAAGGMTDDYRAEGTYGGADLATYKNLWYKDTAWGTATGSAALSTNTDAVRFKYDVGVDSTYFFGAMVIYSDEAAAENCGNGAYENELTITLDTERWNSALNQNDTETTSIRLFAGNDQKADDNFLQNDIEILSGEDNFRFSVAESKGDGVFTGPYFYDHYFDSDNDTVDMKSGISAKRVSKYLVHVIFRFKFSEVFGSGVTAWDSNMSYKLTVSDGFGNTAYSGRYNYDWTNNVSEGVEEDENAYNWSFHYNQWTDRTFADGFELSSGGLEARNWPNMYAADNHVDYMVRSEVALRQATAANDQLGTIETYTYKLLTDYDYLYGAAVVWDREEWLKSSSGKIDDGKTDVFRIWINDGTSAASGDTWQITLSFYLDSANKAHTYLQGKYYPYNGAAAKMLTIYDPDGIEVAINKTEAMKESCDSSGEEYYEYLIEFKVPLSYLMSSIESGVPAYSESDVYVTDYSNDINVYDADAYNTWVANGKVAADKPSVIAYYQNGSKFNLDYNGSIYIETASTVGDIPEGTAVSYTHYTEPPVFNAVVSAGRWNVYSEGLFHSEIISGGNFRIYNSAGNLEYYSSFPIADINNIDTINPSDDNYGAPYFLSTFGTDVYNNGTLTGDYSISFTGWPEDSDMTFTYIERENTTERLDYFYLDGKLEEFFWNNEAERVLVNGGNGYWAQLPAGSEEFDYEYRVYTTPENIYGAFKLNIAAVTNETLINIWFNVDEDATADAGATHQLQFRLVENTSSEENYEFNDDNYVIDWVLTGPDGLEIATSGSRLADGGIEQYVRAVMKTINDETVLEFVMDIDLLNTAKDEANANDGWKEFVYPVYKTADKTISSYAYIDGGTSVTGTVNKAYYAIGTYADGTTYEYEAYYGIPDNSDDTIGVLTSSAKVEYYYKDVTYTTPAGSTSTVRLFYSDKARTDEYLVMSFAQSVIRTGYAWYAEAAELDRLPHYEDTVRDGFEYVVGVVHPVGDETLTLYHNGNGEETFWVSGYNWLETDSDKVYSDWYTDGAGLVLTAADLTAHGGSITVGGWASAFVFAPTELDGVYVVQSARECPYESGNNYTITSIPENGFAYVIHCTNGVVAKTTYAKQAFEKANADFVQGAYIKFTDLVIADQPEYTEYAYYDTVPNTVNKGSINKQAASGLDTVRGDSMGSSIDIYDAGYASLADYTVVNYNASANTIDISHFPDSQNGWSSRANEVPCLTDYIIEKITVDGEHNDTGWDEDGWIYVDSDVNSNLQTIEYDTPADTADGDGEYAYKYQIRTDGEYIYVAAVLDVAMKKDSTEDTDTGSAAPFFRIWFNSHEDRNSGDDGNDYNRLTFTKRYEIVGASSSDKYTVETPDFDSRTYLDGWSLSDLEKTNSFGETMNVQGEKDVNLSVDSGKTVLTYDNVQFRVGEFSWTAEDGNVDWANPTGGVNPNPNINGDFSDYTVTNTFNYGDSAFFGYTEIIEESTTNGSFYYDNNEKLHDTDLSAEGSDGTNFEDGWVAERALRQVTYGNEHATMVEKNGRTYVEFKIGIDEVADENGEFEYSVFSGLDYGQDFVQFYPMVDKEAGIYFPSGYDRFYNPNWYWPTNAFEWNADVEQDLMLRSPYEPVVNIGGQFVDDYYGDGNSTNALKLGGYYIQEYIARQMRDDYGDVIDKDILSGWDYWDVLEMGLIYKAAQKMSSTDELLVLTPSTVTEGATDVEADNIENWGKENSHSSYSVFADYKTFVYYAAIVGIPDSVLNLKYNYRCYVDYYGNDGNADPYEGSDPYYLEYYQTNIQNNTNFMDASCNQTVDCIGDYILVKDGDGFLEREDGNGYVAKYDEFYAPMVNRSCTMVSDEGDIATFQAAHSQNAVKPYADNSEEIVVTNAPLGYIPYIATSGETPTPANLERVEYAAQAAGYTVTTVTTLEEAKTQASADGAGIKNWIISFNDFGKLGLSDDTAWEEIKSFAGDKNVVIVYPYGWNFEVNSIPSDLTDNLTVIDMMGYYGSDGLFYPYTEALGLTGLSAFTSKYVAKGNVNLHTHYYGDNTNLVEYYIDELGVTANKNNVQGIEVLVLTSAEQEAVDNLLADLSDNLSEGIPTTVINTVDGAKGYKFNDIEKSTLVDFDELLITIPNIGRMLGYSSWKDKDTSVFIALSTAISRYAYLEYAASITSESHTGFVKSLAFSLISDIAYEIDYKNVDVSEAGKEELGVAAIRNKAFREKADEIANYINCSDIISVITDSAGRTDLYGGGKLLIGNLEYKLSGSQITGLTDLATAGNTADMVDCKRANFEIFITDGINHAYEGEGGETYVNTALNTAGYDDDKQHQDQTTPVLQYTKDAGYIFEYDGSFGSIDADDMSDKIINVTLNGDLNDGQTNATIIGSVLPDVVTDLNLNLGVEQGNWFAFVDDRISYDTRWKWTYVQAGTDENGNPTKAHYERLLLDDYVKSKTNENGSLTVETHDIYVWQYKRINNVWQTVFAPAKLYVESWSAVNGKRVFIEDEVEGEQKWYEASHAGLYTAYWQHYKKDGTANTAVDPWYDNETVIYLTYADFGEHYYRYSTSSTPPEAGNWYTKADGTQDTSGWSPVKFYYTNEYNTGGSIDNLSIPLTAAQETPVTNEGFSNATYYNECDYSIFWYSRIVSDTGGTNSFWKYGQSGYGEIIIDVGEVKDLEAIRLHLGNAADAMAWGPAMEVYYTTDASDYGEDSDISNVTWKKIGNVATEYTLIDEHVYWTTAALDVSSRYIKVRFKLNNGDVYYVDEIEVYGSPNTTATSSSDNTIDVATYNVGQMREVYLNTEEKVFKPDGTYAGESGWDNVTGVIAGADEVYGTADDITAAETFGAIFKTNYTSLDVIMLQEVNQYNYYGFYNQIKLFAEAAGYPYYYFAHANESGDSKYELGAVDLTDTKEYESGAGVAIISKYPIVAARTYYQNSGESAVAYAQIDVKGTYIDIYSAHFAANASDRAATHDKRMDQYALINHVLENRTEYSIVGGDFNERWLTTYGENVDGMDIVLDTAGGSDTTIQDNAGNRKTIDNILVDNSSIKEKSHYVVNGTGDTLNNNADNPKNAEGYSDHYMATVTFEFLPQ